MRQTPRVHSSGSSLFSRPNIPYFIIVGFTFLAYANIVNNSLFLDDLDFIVENSYIRDWHYFPKFFSQHMTAGAGKVSDYYRPMIQVMFLIGYSAWELNPMGYHLLSILFHAANGLLLYKLLLQITDSTPAALIIALIFIAHPAQTESVASASALGILLGMFFGLTALLGHWDIMSARHSTFQKIFIACISYLATIASILSKETMVVLPGLIFLTSFYFLEHSESLLVRFKKSFLSSLPYLAIGIAYVFLRFTVLNFGGTGNLYRTENVFTSNWTARLFTFMVVFKELLKIALWPSPLFMERATLIPVYLSGLSVAVLKGWALFGGSIFVGLWLSFKKSLDSNRFRLIPFGIFWFLFCLVPVSNIFIPISTTIVESWLYMSMAGILMTLTGLASMIFSSMNLNKMPDRLWIIFPSAILALCVIKTIKQNRVWKNPTVFYENNLKYAPESARFRNNLAMAYSDHKRNSEAIDQYQKAILTNDQYPETHHNLASLYQTMGRLADAEREFYRAIQMNSKFFFSYMALSSLYLNAHRPDLAQRVLEGLIKNVPERWEGYYNLGIVYSLKGDKKTARTLWQQGLGADPYNKTLKQILEKN